MNALLHDRNRIAIGAIESTSRFASGIRGGGATTSDVAG